MTFNVTAANDAPGITAADTLGSMTEHAVPTAGVDGSFETGDLTGWIVSSTVSADFTGMAVNSVVAPRGCPAPASSSGIS